MLSMRKLSNQSYLYLSFVSAIDLLSYSETQLDKLMLKQTLDSDSNGNLGLDKQKPFFA